MFSQGILNQMWRQASGLLSAILLTGLVATFVLIPVAPASAQTTGGFAISPPTAELSGTPGETITRKFDIYNNSDAPQEFAAEFGNLFEG